MFTITSEHKEYEHFIEQERYEQSLIMSNYKVGKHDSAVAIAIQMKNDSEPIDKIIKYTGLTKSDIEKL